MEDIRWEQRFSNYVKAFTKLEEAVVAFVNDAFNLDENNDLTDDILKEGLIQRFEYTHELAWNVMKDFAYYQGNAQITGSRDATREAFQMELISDGEVWMDMIQSRNLSSHTYNEATANDIFEKVIRSYYPAFRAFRDMMESKRSSSGTQGSIF